MQYLTLKYVLWHAVTYSLASSIALLSSPSRFVFQTTGEEINFHNGYNFSSFFLAICSFGDQFPLASLWSLSLMPMVLQWQIQQSVKKIFGCPHTFGHSVYVLQHYKIRGSSLWPSAATKPNIPLLARSKNVNMLWTDHWCGAMCSNRFHPIFGALQCQTLYLSSNGFFILLDVGYRRISFTPCDQVKCHSSCPAHRWALVTNPAL